MAKFLLLSIVLVTIGVPMLAAREANAHRGLRKTILIVAVYSVMYFLAVKYLYPRLR